MAGSGAGWLFLDASWETLLEMASCTGADTDAEYGSMTFLFLACLQLSLLIF